MMGDMDRTPAPHGRRDEALRIGQLARRAGESVKTIRYWEDEGLLEAERSESGYRLFDAAMVERARFLRRAQGLGFTLAELRSVLELRGDGVRPCDEVHGRLAAHLAQVRARLAELRALEAALEERLAWAAEHPDPDCRDLCVYLEDEV